MEPPAPGSVIRSVDRAMVLLGMLADSAPHPLRVSDVAEQLDVTPASASRLFATLSARGYASQLPDRRFTVGPRALELAVNWIGPLRVAIDPGVARLADATGHAVAVAVVLGTHMVPVRLSVPAGHLLDQPGLAQRVAISSTALGEALAAGLPDRHRRRVLARASGDTATGREPRHERGTFLRDHNGGLRCYARALTTTDGQTLSLSVMVDNNRPGGTGPDAVRHELATAAARLASVDARPGSAPLHR